MRHTSVDVSEPPKPKKETPPPATIQAKPIEPPIRAPQKPIHIEDEADFADIMGGADLDELAPELSREFMLSPSDNDPRFRLHRKVVLERLPEINTVLSRKGQTLRASDFRQKDPVTGFNLWHVAAATNHFENALQAITNQGEWPGPDDFTERTEAGKSITDVLEDMNRLSGVLHAEVWNQHPRLLAALLAQRPPAKQASYASLITRTNLLILHNPA